MSYHVFKSGLVLGMCLLLATYPHTRLLAQPTRPAQIAQAGDDERVTLERADELRKDPNNPTVRKLVRQVIVRHKGTVFYCDSAYLHENRNAVDAFGNTRMVSDNGTLLMADSMYYDGSTQIARAIGKVKLNDEKMSLDTKQLDYHAGTGMAYYYAGGRLEDQEKILTSERGSYDTNAKIFYFEKKVKLQSKRQAQTIDTEYLTYNSISKLSYFKGKTTITSPDGVVHTTEGTFNTDTQVSNFKGRTQLQDKDYFLEGDSVYFDNQSKIGFAQGKVKMRSKADSVEVQGDFGWYRGREGESKVYGKVLVQQVSERDTLWLTTDTLYTIQSPDKSRRLLLAYRHVRIFRRDFQGICDSLAYNRNDSTLTFYHNPVLWSKKSQIFADTIRVQMANNRLRTAHFRHEAYMISLDTLEQYNQLKGKNMQAFFTNNQLRRMEVRNNAQNLYFARDEKTRQLIGLNRIECTDINVTFKEDNQIYRLAYLNKPEALFIPPHEIEMPQTRFKNFRWRINEQPTLEMMLQYDRFLDSPKPSTLAELKEKTRE